MTGMFRTGWQTAALAAAGGAGALALAGWVGSRITVTPGNPMSGDVQQFAWHGRQVAFASRGRGVPVVLVHDVHPGASSLEFSHLYTALATGYRVFALDMLGFGASDRPAIRYTPALYQQLLLDFVTHVAGAADQPVHVIASRHSAAFLVRAAAERPQLFERLVLIEPAGITTRRVLGTPAMREMALRLLHAPVPGLMAYDLLASRPGMRYFLRMAYKRPTAVTRAVVTAHRREALRRGARFAPACYLTGMLDTTSREALVRLRLPILLAWGRHARLMPVEHIPLWLRIYPRADLRLFNAGDFPHSETADDFLKAVSTWLGEPLATRQA